MDDALRTALAAGLPFSGLRDHRPHRLLWNYVPRTWALEHEVVPVSLEHDVLLLAAATATVDLTALQRNLPNLRIALTIAPAAEIRAALTGPRELD